MNVKTDVIKAVSSRTVLCYTLYHSLKSFVSFSDKAHFTVR